MDLKKLIAKVLEEKEVWSFRAGHIFFRIVSRLVARHRPDGSYAPPFSFFVMDRGNSVAALVHLVDVDKIILVRQYRAGTNSYELELPAGMVDGNEDSLDAVVREVSEETGFAFRSIKHLFHLKLSPGSYTEESDVYLFRTQLSLKKGSGGGKFEESEEMEVFFVDVDDAIEMKNSGVIQDAKTFAALQWLEANRKK